MKPAPFEYHAVSSLDAALELLEQYGEDAKILAGGQSLVPMMNFRLVRPKYLIDINYVGSLSYIRQSNGHLHIGAMTRHRELERSPLVEQRNGLLVEGVRLIGHGAIRSRGTVGGSIAHADPTAELPTMLAALDGSVKVARRGGDRIIPWSEFFVTYFTTALEQGEICTEVIVPSPGPRMGWAFEEFTLRHGDFALVGAAVVLEIDAAHRCSAASLAIGGAGPVPVRAKQAEAFLMGQQLTPQLMAEAGRLVSGEVEPEGDLHASEQFRRHLAGTMATRALVRAAERAELRTRRR
jgi:CO/xanthine dehydrogenase FAD-binding subunit